MNEQREQVLLSMVKLTGELDAARVTDRLPLYTGRNGKVIERFWVDMDGQRESYIFKPLTNRTTCGREKWIYERLLGSISVRVPALYASAEHDDPERYWAIYEDMGEMSHQLTDDDYAIAAACIPLWHSLPLDRVPSHFNGDKTNLIDLKQEVLNGYYDMGKRLLQLGFDKEKVVAIEQLIRQWNGTFETEIVISHGDFHQGNVCRCGDEFIILDWEFMHHNSVFWDLYSLLDMSHPDFPKKVSASTRLDALCAYLNQRTSLGWEADFGNFIADYHRYVIVYSLWMLGLIERDLQKGQWDTSKLLRAQQETLYSLEACLAYCDIHKLNG